MSRKKKSTREVSTDEEYEVETILDKETRPDGIYYFIKWKGYDE